MSDTQSASDETAVAAKKKLTPEARRALAEAEERRRAAGPAPERPPEFLGPSGPEPVRYGDWERKGIASDF
ncbi:DUF1674 domain-containing protein [Rhodoblastus sphagnicola]|uniref:DUF1674 domain-containing protein n=1 Tax=Rhodoblastus sphagnicola TaxID=333368 RepID=A0A2S6NEN3_9HYPH|nr:succinate dehydrogenase assembly factor 4 [Rhodoblastus sphagnicola]MBB4199965.1 hypothetical protein [Rhodoblastus sphagnicola]PPQ33078.1 DUF1674 domain-containing protein [Rhodoblastus sphagnicola]